MLDAWPGDYCFVLGDSLLVAPMLDDATQREVALPAGSKWYDWWAPDGDAIDGGQTITSHVAVDRDKIPLFLREGAIVPLDIANDVTGIAGAWAKQDRTILVVPSSTETRQFVLHDEDDKTTQISSQIDADHLDHALAHHENDRTSRARRLGQQRDDQGQRHLARDSLLPDEGANMATWGEAAKRLVWVRVPASETATTVTIGN